MITIVKDNDVRTVSKGLYEDLYKGMGFAPIEDKKQVKEEVKPVKEEEEVKKFEKVTPSKKEK